MGSDKRTSPLPQEFAVGYANANRLPDFAKNAAQNSPKRAIKCEKIVCFFSGEGLAQSPDPFPGGSIPALVPN